MLFPAKRPARRRSQGPTLRFTPTAWAKLQFFCHRGDTEIGGFAITAADDLLRVEDFVTVHQTTGVASVSFDDAAVADLFETQVDAGRKPEQFARIWLHTHPGDSATPSLTDEDTFERVFGFCDWAIMFVLARGGNTYARLRFNVGPGGGDLIPAVVDYLASFGAADHAAWEAEYLANIVPDLERWNMFDSKDKPPSTPSTPSTPSITLDSLTASTGSTSSWGRSLSDDFLEDLEAMEPEERRMVFEELATRPELWQDTGVVCG